MERPFTISAAAALLLALLVGVGDGAGARRTGNRSRRNPGIAAAGAAPIADIVAEYDWDVAYWSSDLAVDGESIAEHGGGTTLASAGTNATPGQSSTGLTSAGLPVELVDDGMLLAAGSAGYLGSVPLSTPGLIHIRWVMRAPAQSGTPWFWRWAYIATMETRYVSGAIRFRSLFGVAKDVNATLVADKIAVFDIVNRPGGLFSVYANGALVGELSGAPSLDFSNAASALTIGGSSGLNQAPHTTFFLGIRRPVAFTLAEHEASAAKVGLSGGY